MPVPAYPIPRFGDVCSLAGCQGVPDMSNGCGLACTPRIMLLNNKFHACRMSPSVVSVERATGVHLRLSTNGDVFAGTPLHMTAEGSSNMHTICISVDPLS